jgi:curved DNA-binding protein CbpA
MKNAFEALRIGPRLVIDAEELNAAFREAGKSAHPDAGGREEEFATLREALEILASPSRRLRHWLELRGIGLETRGAVDPEVMDLFSTVGEATQRAEAHIRKREETKSALGLAMLERETHLCRESVEQALGRVERAIDRECRTFPVMQDAVELDPAAASKTARNLAFLEKWRAGLRGLFARLV